MILSVLQITRRSAMKTSQFISVLVCCVLLAKLTRLLKAEDCVDGTFLSTYMTKEGTCVACPRQLKDCYKEKIADQSTCLDRCAKKYSSRHTTNTIVPSSSHKTSLYTLSTKKTSSKTTSGAINTSSSPTIQNTTSVIKGSIVDKTSLYTISTKKTSSKTAPGAIITSSSPTIQNTTSIIKDSIVDKTWFFVVMVLVACSICAIIGSCVLYDRCAPQKKLTPVNVEEPEAEDCDRNQNVRPNNLELNEPVLRSSNSRLGGIQPDDEISPIQESTSYRSSSIIADEKSF